MEISILSDRASFDTRYNGCRSENLLSPLDFSDIVHLAVDDGGGGGGSIKSQKVKQRDLRKTNFSLISHA